jgi:hypothetical protein
MEGDAFELMAKSCGLQSLGPQRTNQTKGGREMKNGKFWFGLLMGFCLGVILMLMLIDIIGLI